MLILKLFFRVYNSRISTQALAGDRAGGLEWAVRVRLLSSKAWSHGLAEGSTNICEMDTEEQGREEPSLWCLMFTITEPDLAIFNCQSVSVVPCGLGSYPAFLSEERIPLGQQKKAHWLRHSEKFCHSVAHTVHALWESSLPEDFPSP